MDEESSVPTPKRLKLNPPSQNDDCSIEIQQTDTASNLKENNATETTAARGCLAEEDVGITEYISSHEGFNGIIKQRYSDFLVNEIDIDGHVVRLTDISAPSEEKEEQIPDNILTEEWKEKLQNLLDNKVTSDHVNLETGNPSVLTQILMPSSEEVDYNLRDKVSDNKEERRLVHQCIRQCYRDLDSSTVDVEDKKVIKVVYCPVRNRKRRAKWPADRGQYCHFVLYKENIGTMEAINLIGKFRNMKPRAFTYAGTKDRRAITCQDISVHRVSGANLFQLNKVFRNMTLGNFRYKDKPLKLGNLTGNHFKIILRNVTGTEDQIKQAMDSLTEFGFINYYGMQRFGTTSVPTHHVGRCLLKGNWVEAIDLILKPRAGDLKDLADARRLWAESQNADQCLQVLGRNDCVEKQLFTGLKARGLQDPLGSLCYIPRNTRMMYVHAYQSYVWNTLVSRRLKEFERKPIVGDLVSKAVIPEVTGTAEDDKTQEEHNDHLRPVIVTAENISDFTAYDVVMPLPGYDTVYPDNTVAEWYRVMLEQDGLNVENMRHKVRDYSLPGGYRKMLVKPEDSSWERFTYDDVTQPYGLNDLEKLQNKQLPPQVTDGKYKALMVEFSLPSSTYATMAIREVLKSDTSAAHQSTLNVT